jgi:hypothetical protein
MPQKKRILTICHGPIALGLQYKSPWEDVWLRWKGKPGRRRYSSAPTLVCRAELIADLESDRCLQNKRSAASAGDIEHDKAMLDELECAPYAVDDWDPPNVYTRANGINRAEAERMLAFLLERRYKVLNPKFEWKKKTGFCIMPTGFGDYSITDPS